MDELTGVNLNFLPDDPDGIFLVGGIVRDLLAGHPPADIDLVVAGDIVRSAGQIAEKTGGRVIDLGKTGFDMVRVASPEMTVDITPLDHPSIESDLQHRDFTINAMAYDVKARRLVDCTGGRADMRQKKIRMVSPAAFENDPARLVRAYRMAAVMHYSIDDGTEASINRHRHLIGSVAGERIWAELVKIFGTTDASPVIMRMAASGLLTAIFPELQPAVGCTQNRHHPFDVFDHSLRVVDALEALLPEFGARFPRLAGTAGDAQLSRHAAMLKYAALLHDVGKPATRQVGGDGQVRFHGHAARGAAIATAIGRRLKLSSRQRHVSDAIIRHHIRPLFLYLASEKGSLGRTGTVRFFNRCGDLALPIIVHTMADIMAKGGAMQDRDSGFINFCHRLLDDYIDYNNRQAVVPPLISGNDLISVFGLSPSPRFKHILKRLDEGRLSGEMDTRDQALRWVGAYLSSESGGQRSEP
ncbi:MAG: HD domain-containing protein [Desulfobacteraceae bacterium]|jgi:putative nucleotidyltransferase with HDIG domain|nr:HD domain-containing protein [Desulfobacteraceae bacterium]